MIETKPSGAIWGWKFAELTTPLALTDGGAPAAAPRGIRLNPDSVRTNAVVPDASTAIDRPRMLRRAPVRAIAPGPSSPGAEALVWNVDTSTSSTRPASAGAAVPAVTGVE